ncbi:MAG: hypothetical protein IPK58_08010 [Acidobacteria bacterium]|nr:hypothetical protein [Acidobacteriota bacterium]
MTMTVNGVAAGLKFVSRRQIEFIVPPGLRAADAGATYPVVINNNGTVIRGNIVVVPARPDLFTDPDVRGPGGRVKALNVVNRVYARTVCGHDFQASRKPSCRDGSTNSSDRGEQYRIDRDRRHGCIGQDLGDVTVSGATVITNPVLVEPGVYTIDVTLPQTLAGAGDRPIIVSVFVNGIIYTSRLDSSAARISIL